MRLSLITIPLLLAVALSLNACDLTLFSNTDNSSELNQVIGDDERETIENPEKIYGDTIGSLNLFNFHICTAFAISKNQILTANHCFDNVLFEYYTFQVSEKSYKITDYLRLEDIDVVVLTVADMNEAFEEKEQDVLEVSDDFVVSELKENGDAVVFKQFLDTVDFNSGEKLSIFARGYKNIFLKSCAEEKKSRLLKDTILLHALDTNYGSSGSPVMQNGKVVGVHLGYSKELDFNISIPMAIVRTSISLSESNKIPQDKISPDVSRLIEFIRESGLGDPDIDGGREGNGSDRGQNHDFTTETSDDDSNDDKDSKSNGNKSKEDGDSKRNGSGSESSEHRTSSSEKKSDLEFQKSWGEVSEKVKQVKQQKTLAIRKIIANNNYPFRGVAKSSAQGVKLSNLQKLHRRAQREVAKDTSPNGIVRQKFVDIGSEAKNVAYTEYLDGNVVDGDIAHNIAKEAFDLALSLTPYVGFSKDLYEAFSGKRLVDGAKLEGLDRALPIIGVGVGVATFGVVSSGGIKALGKIFGVIKKIASGGRLRKITQPVSDLVSKVFSSAKNVANVRWGTWTDLPRVTVNGTEYAKIGGRRYTRHAVDRMTPTGFGTAAGGTTGRGVPTMVVEATIKSGDLVKTQTMVNGAVRQTWRMGTVEVVTESSKEVVITVMRKGG